MSHNIPPISNLPDCGICLIPLQSDPQEEALRTVALECNHIFHISCITSWIDRKPICPLCRRTILRFNGQDLPQPLTPKELFRQALAIVSPNQPAEARARWIETLGAKWSEILGPGTAPPLIEADESTFTMVISLLIERAIITRRKDVVQLLLDPSIVSLVWREVVAHFALAIEGERPFLQAIPIIFAYMKGLHLGSEEARSILRGLALITAVEHAHIDTIQWLLQDGHVPYTQWRFALVQALSRREFHIARILIAHSYAMIPNDPFLSIRHAAATVTAVVCAAVVPGRFWRD